MLTGNTLRGQNDSIPAVIALDEVALEATRLETSRAMAPMAVSQLEFSSRQGLQQQFTLQEYLTRVPGLFALNATNYAQDLRVSIRGFGSRAAFGIRGIKIIVDGIPETTPDGQGQVDNLPLGLIQSIEVLRGPASSLYGNAAGGTLYINTLDSFEKNGAQLRATFGAFQMRSYQATAFLKNAKTSAVLYLNDTSTEGYRDNSAMAQRQFNARVKHYFSDSSVLRLQLNYTDSPRAEDPGGINLEDATANRQQARQRNVDFDTYEKVNHFKTGLQWEKKLNTRWQWNSYAFYAFRDFYGKLPFETGGIVDLTRNYYGLGTHFTQRSLDGKHQLQAGIETAVQKDQRDRFINANGEQGTNTFSQLETFANFGIFIVDELHFNNWLLRTGLRYDRQRLDTDTRTEAKIYNTVNPSIGLRYRLAPQNQLYARVSSSFETPALSELSANPNGGAGFNPFLEPAQSVNYEMGWKSNSAKTTFEINGFYITTTNEILPYELEAFPGRSFYRNTGATERLGLELLWEQRWKNWRMTTTWTEAKYTFESLSSDDRGRDGNALPGIPGRQITANVFYSSPSGWKLQWEGQHVGSFFADNNNVHEVAAYQLVQLQAQKTFELPWGALSFFTGVQNLLDVAYYDNIRINAFGSRFYEPAPGRTFYGGIQWRL